jgi:hypothetical protein
MTAIPSPDPGSGVVGGRPGRPGPARPRRGGATRCGRPRRPGPLGKVVTQGVPVMSGRRLPSMLGQLPAVLGARVGGLAGRPGSGPLPRRCLTGNTSRILHRWRRKPSPSLSWRSAPGDGRDGQPPVSPGGGEDAPSARAALLASSTARPGPPDVPVARVLAPCASSWTDVYVWHWHTSHGRKSCSPWDAPRGGELVARTAVADAGRRWRVGCPRLCRPRRRPGSADSPARHWRYLHDM